MRIGLNSPQDVITFLMRRRWWIIGPFLMLSCAVGLMVWALPQTYVSTALILVRGRDVPEQFVMNMVAESTELRLKTIQTTVLSRSQLKTILDEFGPRLKDLRPYNVDEKIARLRNQILIAPRIEKIDGRTTAVPYFTIQYQNESPDLAQQVTEKLTAMVLNLDLQTRSDKVTGSRVFLEDESRNVEQQLQQSEARVKELKAGRLFDLPEQLPLNQSQLDRLQHEKQANGEAIDRNRSLVIDLESRIAVTNPVITREVTPPPQQRPSQQAAQAPQDPLVAEYIKLKSAVDLASTAFGPKHPDYLAGKIRLEKLRDKLPAATVEALDNPAPAPAEEVPAAPAVTAEQTPNPAYLQLQSQLAAAKAEALIEAKDKQRIEVEIAKYMRRIENTPQTELMMADVIRENEELQKRHAEYKTKLEAARLSESLETNQRAGQFLVQDPASYPLDPSKPNKLLVFLAGCALSLGVALLFALVVDVARQRVWNQSEVEKFWGVPVLVDVPEILTDSDLLANRKKRFTFSLSAVGATLAWGVCLYGLYWKRGFVLQHLDPLLQRLIY